MPAVREAELYSLPEVSRATGIPLPDLQRLRRDHAEEVPSVAVGEAKRYPDEALAVFRRLHRQEGGDGEELKPQRTPAAAPRASFSLSAQRRGNGAATPGEPAAEPPAGPAEEVVDPGPPNVFDEMALALGQLGGDDPQASAPVVPRAQPVGQRSKRNAERPAPPEAGSLAAAIARVQAAKAAKGSAPQSAALRDTANGGEPTAEEPAGERVEETANGHAAAAQPAQAERSAEPTNGHAEPREAEIARPAPPLYTLQQIHERTGIPYSKLSLLAASHGAEIPSAGERYSPAYPLAGLEAFCRIYGEQNPGWEPPPLGPEPGWDDDDGIAARINALAALQERWSDQLEIEIDRFARPWTGQAIWE